MNNPKLTFKVEPALEAELARFRERQSLLDKTELIAHIGHYEWSYELGCLLSCSEEYARIHDMSVQEVLEAHSNRDGILRQVHPDDLENFVQAWKDLEHKHGVDRDYRLVCDSGEIRHIREFAVEVTDEQGKAIGAFGILQDISDTVKYERDLEYRDELARQSEAITDIGHFIYDEQEELYEYVSEGFVRIYGSTAEELKGQKYRVSDYLSEVFEEDRERVAAEYRRFINDADNCVLEYRIVRADGSIRWLRELSRAKKIEDGKVRQTLGAIQDITPQKTIEQELLYKDALANQAEAITEIGHFIFDLVSETYAYISPGFARIHGVSVDEYRSMVNSRDDDIDDVHPEDYDRVLAAYTRHKQSGEDFNIDYRIFRSDGEIRWIREQGTSVPGADGESWQSIGVIQDITEQKSTEERLREARDSLEQMVKNRTRKLAETVRQLQDEIREREKISAELAFLANHDALTGLPSLRLCKDRLDHSLAEARRNHQLSSVMFLDLDGFKEVNDAHGHEFGDRVLQTIAERITAEIRETDTVARIGGDEFVIISSGLPDRSIAERIAANLIRHISHPVNIETDEVVVSASIGVAFYPGDGSTAEELIRSADKAMYRVKRQGKNNFGFAASREA